MGLFESWQNSRKTGYCLGRSKEPRDQIISKKKLFIINPFSPFSSFPSCPPHTYSIQSPLMCFQHLGPSACILWSDSLHTCFMYVHHFFGVYTEVPTNVVEDRTRGSVSVTDLLWYLVHPNPQLRCRNSVLFPPPPPHPSSCPLLLLNYSSVYHYICPEHTVCLQPHSRISTNYGLKATVDWSLTVTLSRWDWSRGKNESR